MNYLNNLGKGYSISNLKYMRVFYKAYPKLEELKDVAIKYDYSKLPKDL